MGVSFTFLIAIAFFLASLAAQCLGVLVVRRHPPDTETSTRQSTRISNDDSALILSYDYNQGNAAHGGRNAVEGSVMFSARGRRDVRIYFCANSDPRKGPCFWIIIGGWEAGRSSIWSCVGGVPRDEHPPSSGRCSRLARTEHEVEDVLDAREWRTFRLTWMSGEKKIQIFRDTDNEDEPFLQGQVERWDPVSHISVGCDEATRVRFHFYEYFLTENKDAELSEPHFIRYGENSCAELVVGLCPDCELKIDLIDGDNRPISTDTISPDTKFAGDRPLPWRSINLRVKLQEPIPKFVQFKIATILNGDKAKGQWAVDSFDVCKSVGSLRKSTVKIHRERSDPSLWQRIKRRELSYVKSAAVDSDTVSLDTSSESNTARHRIRGEREIRIPRLSLSLGFSLDSGLPPPAVRNLQVDESDPDTNTINLRWMPPSPANGEIEFYKVQIDGGIDLSNSWIIEASDGIPMCELWSDYVCFGNLALPANSESKTFIIAVYAKNKGVQERGTLKFLKTWPALDYDKAPGSPLNVTAVQEGAGVTMVRWMHPSFSYTKITRFEITVMVLNTDLQEAPFGRYHQIQMNYTIAMRQKDYSETLYLLPSTRYRVSIVAVNKRGKKSPGTYTELNVPANFGFANGANPNVTFDGTSIDVEMPVIVNATLHTTVEVIVRGLSTCARTQSRKSSPPEDRTTSLRQWDAAIYPVRDGTPKSLKIFVEQNHGVRWNCSLHLGETYTIVFYLTDHWSLTLVVLKTYPVTLTRPEPPLASSNLVAWLAIFPVLAVCVIVLIVLQRYRKRVRRAPRRTNRLDSYRPSLTATRTNELQAPYSPKDSMPQVEVAEDRLYTLPKEHDSCSVRIEDFEKYVQHAAANGRLYSQFTLFRRGLTKPCEYGRVRENIPKNRYGNLIPYDDTRVVLEKIPGDPYSDYINASYIKGYKKERAYIAAQGPTPNTVNDFWRMVWEQKVGVICMLTNVTEGTETMCEKYWPDVGARVNHGGFHISNIDEQVFADYTFRTFELSHRRNMRKITHLHYTGWPVIGVPTYPGSFVAYLKKLEQTPAGNRPVVVHCSTGDGRTGTIIACDICLRQAVAEKVIDVTAVITRMRDDRANMVNTLQQYLLAHIVIMESIVPWPTQLSCTDVLSTRMQRVRIQLPFDIERLNDTKWQKQALESLAVPISSGVENAANSRMHNSVPVTYVSFRSDLLESESNQINAVSVDGVKVKKQYLASWLPPPIGLFNFWGFVTKRDVKLIVILQCSDARHPSCIDIMPDALIVVPMLDIRVVNRTTLAEGEFFTNEQLLLNDTSQGKARSQSVTVLTCKGWEYGKNAKPPPPATLISLWRATEKIPRKKGETLVLCHDGITGCGLYLALSFLLERMVDENECDVIAAVQAIRRSEPEFVQSMEQFEYLYDAAVNYVENEADFY